RQRLGEAEVGNLRGAVRLQQDVRRLQVAVDDALLVDVLHRPGQALDQRGRLAGRLRDGAELAVEAPARNELEREERLALVRVDRVQADNVRVLQACHRGGLGLETASGREVRVGAG